MSTEHFPGCQSFCAVSLRAPVENFHWKFSFSKSHSTVHLKLIFLNELPTFQSCLICLMMSSLVLAMAKDGGLSTENTSRKACPEIIERCRMAGNWGDILVIGWIYLCQKVKPDHQGVPISSILQSKIYVIIW